ncbi:GDSL-type esterase/lipase family protein [Stenotrophobium rhamnosiphilum]|uniref:G-D-S-L family lipolytic protein n=1 Tax=Stenotrophobium rhamnosiphilum TaxID=2029166 RepID=A0A2T5MG72_9GAMM|nr:GDSL-type esterase/lipase family protein [Stenotrophobium rhamnosiphilum]PTU31563.1 G-D-S-L family lipolytic protein [Stenotrophobium rhamnosiphilum]
MRISSIKKGLLLLSVVVLGLSGCAQSSSPDGASENKSGWIGAWGAAPYGPYPLGPLSGVLPLPPEIALPPIPTALPNNHALDQSFRMIVHPTIGGEQVRVRLSNLMGDKPVTFSPVRIAKRLLVTGPVLVPNTDTPVLFDGRTSVTVAAGAEAISDPASFSYGVGDDLAISFHVQGESGAITWHAVSFALNYVSLPSSGDVTGDVTGLSFIQPTVGWFFLTGLDVLAPESPGTIVAIGDSITDGAYIVPETNTRWPDFFAQRLQSAGIAMGVLNEGINSNTVTTATSPDGDEFKGPPAVLRFKRDVLQRPGVRSVVIFEGTNDLSDGAKAEDVFAGIRSLVKRAHAAGLCVVVGTIMPRIGTPIAPWDAAMMDPERQKLNAMIRAQTDIEGVADFDKAMESPLLPGQPNVPYYFPDQLHPNSVGTLIMANSVPLEALVPPPAGNCSR